MRIAGELDAWFVDVPTGACGLQVVDDDLGLRDVERVGRRADVGGDLARAVDLPCAGCEPGPGAGEPAGDAAGRTHGDGPDRLRVRQGDGAGEPGIELIALAVDLQLGRVHARRLVRNRIEQAGGFGTERELRLGPDSAVAQGDAKLRKIADGRGGELVALGLLPVELCGAGAGELHAAQIDELAKLLGEAVEIERGIGGEFLERAGGLDAEELRIALQRIEGQRAVFAAEGEVRADRLVPAERLAGACGGELGGAYRAGERLAGGRGLQAAGEFDRAGRNRRVAANTEGVGQHRGEAGDIDRAAKFDIVVPAEWERRRGRVLRWRQQRPGRAGRGRPVGRRRF